MRRDGSKGSLSYTHYTYPFFYTFLSFFSTYTGTFIPLYLLYITCPLTFLPIPCAFLSIPCAFLSIPCAFLPIPCAFLPIPCAFMSIPCAFLSNVHYRYFLSTEHPCIHSCSSHMYSFVPCGLVVSLCIPVHSTILPCPCAFLCAVHSCFSPVHSCPLVTPFLFTGLSILFYYTFLSTGLSSLSPVHFSYIDFVCSCPLYITLCISHCLFHLHSCFFTVCSCLSL